MHTATEEFVIHPYSLARQLSPHRKIKKTLHHFVSGEAIEFISSHLDLECPETVVMDTASIFNVESIDEETTTNFVNIKRINDARFLNKYFEEVNRKLPDGGLYIGCAETMEERAKRLLRKYPKVFSYPYYALDFVLKRVFPKWKITRRVYFFITQGRNRVLALPEILGRLISCGFEILEHREIDNLLFFAAKKVDVPFYDTQASYGPLFKMRRVGKGGKIINVYKMRTMHPYSEYLQGFVFEKNNLQAGGKIKDDFRITRWGHFLRRFWIDEFPMIINLFKGELKLVGVRPLSLHYLSLYRTDLRERRLQYMPGLVPPFYADLPTNLAEIMDSEERYLDAYDKNPIRTDIRYFFKAFYNIVIKHARSS